jgi:alanine racemase
MMYGYNPVSSVELMLKPALTLKSHTSVVRTVLKGEGVSYNHTWTAHQDSKVAVVPIGYADGWHRLLSNRAEVLWNGEKAPLVGNICMDYLMVDVTQHPILAENEVVFFGQSRTGSLISAADVAQKAQTIPWEI